MGNSCAHDITRFIWSCNFVSTSREQNASIIRELAQKCKSEKNKNNSKLNTKTHVTTGPLKKKKKKKRKSKD